MKRALVIVSLATCLSGCATHGPAAAPSTGRSGILETRVGLASYYGRDFHGQITASGARFDMNALVAAHPSYPFGTRVRVTNLANDRSTVVRVRVASHQALSNEDFDEFGDGAGTELQLLRDKSGANRLVADHPDQSPALR